MSTVDRLNHLETITNELNTRIVEMEGKINQLNS